MDFLHTIFGTIGDLTWGWSLIPFLVIFGVFITIATGFVQVRYFRRMFRVLKGDNQSSDPNTITAGEALFVSVGGRVGAATLPVWLWPLPSAVRGRCSGCGRLRLSAWPPALWNARWRRYSNVVRTMALTVVARRA